MGPSWTELVEEGLRSFPQATHGILADAVSGRNECIVLLLFAGLHPSQLIRQEATGTQLSQSHYGTARALSWLL